MNSMHAVGHLKIYYSDQITLCEKKLVCLLKMFAIGYVGEFSSSHGVGMFGSDNSSLNDPQTDIAKLKPINKFRKIHIF